MRNHVIDNTAILAKQISERKAYQAAKNTDMLLKKFKVEREHQMAKEENVLMDKRNKLISLGLIKG